MKSSEPEFITIGQILLPRGIKGKLKVKVVTDFPQRFAPASKVYVNQQPMTIDGAEWHKGNAIIKFNAIDSLDAAQKLKGQPSECRE
jgi:16S rRNA processing protein RimM